MHRDQSGAPTEQRSRPAVSARESVQCCSLLNGFVEKDEKPHDLSLIIYHLTQWFPGLSCGLVSAPSLRGLLQTVLPEFLLQGPGVLVFSRAPPIILM